MTKTVSRSFKVLLILALAAYSISLIVDLSKGTSLRILQWDFAPYYFAAKAYEQELNPYDINNLTLAAGTYIGYRFVYPPPTLWFFRAFTIFPYPVAAQVWLFLKLALLISLIIIWRRYFMPDRMSILFYLMLLFAFDAAVYWDLKTGNVSLVEQFFIWVAFLFLLRKKPLAFCLFILAASMFKITPILFLLLLPMCAIRNGRRYLIGGFAAFVLLVAVFSAVYPELVGGYLSSASSVEEGAKDFNYATLPFLYDIARTIGGMTGVVVPRSIPVIAYIMTIGVFLWFSARAWRWRNPARIAGDDRLIILFACVVYALIVPRMKCYAYILLLLPAFFIMMKYAGDYIYPFVFLLLIIPVHNPLPQHELIDYYRFYYLLYMSFLIWVMYAMYIRKSTAESSSGVPGARGGREHIMGGGVRKDR